MIITNFKIQIDCFRQFIYFCLSINLLTLNLYNGTKNFKAKNPVVTIGTFDGVHLGHRKVIEQLNEIAKATNGESVLFTFYPHPRLVVSKNPSNLRLLTTLDEKKDVLTQTGIDNLVVYPFTKEVASLEYEDFVKKILIEKLNIKTLVVGHDHRFGKDRKGTFENIVELSKKYGFDVIRIDAFLVGEVDVSSTKIRNAFQAGKIEVANKYLGYRYSLTGEVTEGNRIGRSIHFPTANVVASDPNKLIPLEGVYAVMVEQNGNRYKGMLNIGNRPTVNRNADHRTIEVHIFDFNKDIYKQQITIEFVKRIRDEKKFDSLEALKVQLNLDKETSRNLLQEVQ